MKIKSGLKLTDGKIITSTMSDDKWDLLCLVDRLFHPDKYWEHENVDKAIKRIINRLKGRCQSRIQRISITDFVNQIRNLSEEQKAEAETDILKQIAEAYK